MIRAKDLILITSHEQDINVPISFDVKDNQSLWIQGENGSGKSTLLRKLFGQDIRTKGELEFPYSAREIFWMPQLQEVFFHIPLLVNDVVSFWNRSQTPLKTILEIGLLDEEALKRPWNTASGGERQKAILTACLLSETKVLFLDEPFNHLDSKSIQQVQKCLHLKIGKKMMVIVSHQVSPIESNPKCITVQMKRSHEVNA